MVRVAADPPFEVLSVKEDPAVTESEGKTTGSTDRSTTEFTEEIGRTEVIRLSPFNEIEKSIYKKSLTTCVISFYIFSPSDY